MSQKFFTNTIKGKFIKSLIYNTPLPIYSTVNEDSFMVKDTLYIYKTGIFKCTKTGFPNITGINYLFTNNGSGYDLTIDLYNASSNLGGKKILNSSLTSYGITSSGEANISFSFNCVSKEISALSISETSVDFPTLVSTCSKDFNSNRASFNPVSEYIFGTEYPQMTERYVSNYNYYDSETHEKLGDYLRCLRDIKGINLMPFYNCVSGNYISGLYIKDGEVKSGDNKNVKVLKIPIKFNTKYTLAIDSNFTVSCMPVLLDKFNNLIKVPNNNNVDFNTTLWSNGFENSYMRFTDPIVFEVSNKDTSTMIYFTHGSSTVSIPLCEILQKYEQNLYMLIQISLSNDSSLCVLEGDYLNLESTKIFDASSYDELNEQRFNALLLSNLRLLQFNDKVRYPFSDRLIEYLLLNVITGEEEIDNNISRIQEILGVANDIGVDYDVWSRQLRILLYKSYMNNANGGSQANKLDITGFVDKNIERYLLREVAHE